MTDPQTQTPTDEPASLPVRAPMAVVIINYRTAAMTQDCLASLEAVRDEVPGVKVVIVDNESGDDSPDEIEAAIEARGWGGWAELVRSPKNGGFSFGNNAGIEHLQADSYLLLNSDTIVRAGALRAMHAAMQQDETVGLVGPRLEWMDGQPQVSVFRWQRPTTELIAAACTGPVTKLFPKAEVALGVQEESMSPQWLSFACVLVRRAVIEQIGLMDDGFFMYFEDVDYSRAAAKAGWRIVHEPAAHVVHLRGGTSPVKELQKALKPRPRYYYASRARYYAKWYGVHGLWVANVLWTLGRGVSKLRELVGQKKQRHVCDREWRDIWTNALRPMRGPNR